MRFPRGRGQPPLVMGILNLTPDSFSDGGRWNSPDTAVRHALEMVDQGAAIIDVGAESTRPGFEPIPADEEWVRLEPVLRALADSTDALISVDTVKSSVASKALSAGADIINDVNGLQGEGMMEVCADHGCPVVIGHMPADILAVHGTQMGPGYRTEIKEFLDAQCSKALDKGIPEDGIIIDPGVGFGKT